MDAYPNADEIVQYLLQWKEAGLDYDSKEVYEIVCDVPDRCEATEEEAPPPQLKVNHTLQKCNI